MSIDYRMDEVSMNNENRARKHETTTLKPALTSIKTSCEYMGGVSRSTFYSTVLPKLETVKVGGRNFVVVASMDRLIEANRQPAG